MGVASARVTRPSCGSATVPSSTPSMSDSFMIRRSSPSILTSVPDHLPNSTRSPTLMSIGMSLPASSRPPGPTAMISPCARLLLGGVGNDDAAGSLLLGIDALDDDAVVKRTEFHGNPPRIVDRFVVGKRPLRRSPRTTPGGDIGRSILARKRGQANFLALILMDCYQDDQIFEFIWLILARGPSVAAHARRCGSLSAAVG